MSPWFKKEGKELKIKIGERNRIKEESKRAERSLGVFPIYVNTCDISLKAILWHLE